MRTTRFEFHRGALSASLFGWTTISSVFGRAGEKGASPSRRNLYFGDLHNHNAVGYAKGSFERSVDLAR